MMFEIEYKGANSVVITANKKSIIVDPKLSLVGLKDIKVNDAIELATDERFAIQSDDAKIVIDGPGEYEVHDFIITGIAAKRHIDSDGEGNNATIYRVIANETRIGIIGNIDKKLKESQLEKLGTIDVLVIPVGGGGYTLDAKDAAEVISMVEPKVVIPVHYADSEVKYEVPQEELGVFVKEMNANSVEKVSKYKYSPSVIEGSLQIVEIVRS